MNQKLKKKIKNIKTKRIGNSPLTQFKERRFGVKSLKNINNSTKLLHKTRVDL